MPSVSSFFPIISLLILLPNQIMSVTDLSGHSEALDVLSHLAFHWHCWLAGERGAAGVQAGRPVDRVV